MDRKIIPFTPRQQEHDDESREAHRRDIDADDVYYRGARMCDPIEGDGVIDDTQRPLPFRPSTHKED